MQRFILPFILLLVGFANGQEFKELLLLKDGQAFKIKNVMLDATNNTATFKDAEGVLESWDLNTFDEVKYRKGSHWASGLLGGLGGGLLVSVITAPEDGEWWYGAGPKILAGTAAGALVGALIPKYKALDTKNTAIEVGLNSIKVSF